MDTSDLATKTTSSSTTDASKLPKNSNAPKRKRALLFGYVGKGYKGFQSQGVNPDDLPTIEKAVFRALVEVGGISEVNSDDLQKVGWSRSSRTDAGVSAASQVVGLNMCVPGEEIESLGGNVSERDEAEFIRRLNEALPREIRAYRTFRVPKSFDAYRLSGSRKYIYWFPLSMLSSSSSSPSSSSSSSTTTLTGEEDLLAKVEFALNEYEGTHYFHNFTEGVKPTEPAARRFITRCGISNVFSLATAGAAEKREERVVEVEVSGQSFMIYQIRKMVGFVLDAVIRGLSEEEMQSNMMRALDKGTVVRGEYPVAPPHGLFLDVIYFSAYNDAPTRNAETENIHRERIDFEEDPVVAPAREALKRELVLPSVFPSALEEFARWGERRRGLLTSASAPAFPVFGEYSEPSGKPERGRKIPGYALTKNDALNEARGFLRLVDDAKTKRARTTKGTE